MQYVYVPRRSKIKTTSRILKITMIHPQHLHHTITLPNMVILFQRQSHHVTDEEWEQLSISSPTTYPDLDYKGTIHASHTLCPIFTPTHEGSQFQFKGKLFDVHSYSKYSVFNHIYIFFFLLLKQLFSCLTRRFV